MVIVSPVAHPLQQQNFKCHFLITTIKNKLTRNKPKVIPENKKKLYIISHPNLINTKISFFDPKIEK